MEYVVFTTNSAYDFYKQGVSFLEAACRCFDGENRLIADEPILMHSPIAVNAAFACEMFLKALGRHENKQLHGHSLPELYRALSSENQKKLYVFTCTDEPQTDEQCKENVEKLLTKYSTYFIDGRYIVEKSARHSIYISGILSLAYNLCSVTQEVVKRNETNGETRRRLYDLIRKYTED